MSGLVAIIPAPWSYSQLANGRTIPPAPTDFEYIECSQYLLVLDDKGEAEAILLRAVEKDPSAEGQPLEHSYSQQERAQSGNLASTATKSQSEGSSAYCCPLSTRYGTDTLSAPGSTLRGECYHNALACVASVHEHLLKKHGRPKHCCGRCYQSLTSEELLKAHLVNVECSVNVFRFVFRLGKYTTEAIAAYPGNERQSETEAWSKIHPFICLSSRCLPSPCSHFFKPGISMSRNVDTRQDVGPLSSRIANLAYSPTSLSASSLLPLDSIHAPATLTSLDYIPIGGDYTLQGRNFPGLRGTAFVAPKKGAGLLSSKVGYQFAGINVDPSISAQQEQDSQAGSLEEYIRAFLSAHAAFKGIRQCTGRATGSRSSSGVQEAEPTRSGKRDRDDEGDDISLPGGGDEDNDGSGHDPPPPGSQASTVDVDEIERPLKCPLCILNPDEGYIEKPINDCDKLVRHIWDVHGATMSKQAKDNLRGLFGKKHPMTKNESARIRRWRAITTAVTGLSEAEQDSPYHPTFRRTRRPKHPQAETGPLKKVKTSTEVVTLPSDFHHTMLETHNHIGLGSIGTEGQLKKILDSKIEAVEVHFEVKIREMTAALNEEKSATIKTLCAEYRRNTKQVLTQLSNNPSQGSSPLAPSYSHVVSNARMSAAGSKSFNVDARFAIRGANASAFSAHGQESPTVSEGVQLPRTVAQPSYRLTSSSRNLQLASEPNDAESGNDNSTLVNSEPGNQGFPWLACIDCKFDPLTQSWQFCERCKFQFGFSTF